MFGESDSIRDRISRVFCRCRQCPPLRLCYGTPCTACTEPALNIYNERPPPPSAQGPHAQSGWQAQRPAPHGHSEQIGSRSPVPRTPDTVPGFSSTRALVRRRTTRASVRRDGRLRLGRLPTSRLVAHCTCPLAHVDDVPSVKHQHHGVTLLTHCVCSMQLRSRQVLSNATHTTQASNANAQ